MALNIDTLKTRSLTALIFVLVMLGGLFWNQWSFLALFVLVHFGCWYEYIKIIRIIYGAAKIKQLLPGLLYITLPMAMLLDLGISWNPDGMLQSGLSMGLYIPIAIILSIWINDTMAYLVGSFIGRTPFSKISPKKTWEGTIGGAILCVVAIGLLFPLLFKASILQNAQAPNYFILAGICAIFGTLGDLLESKLKRMANIKDSGTIMPGHGGFLDRFDSLLVATPFVWLYIKLIVG